MARKLLSKKGILFLVVAAVIVVLLIWSRHKGGHTNVQTKDKTSSNYVLLDVADIATVQQATVSNIAAFTGDLVPLNQTIISAQVDSALVLKVLVNEGSFVKKGQTLALLDDKDVRQSVNAKAAALNTAEVQLALSKNTLEKNRELLKESFIAPLKFEELKTDYQAKVAGVKQAVAALQQAKQQLANTVVKAPFAGYIYQKMIDNGQLVNRTSQLFALASLDKMEIKAAIPSEQIAAIKIGQAVSFSVEASNTQYQGVVSRINPVAEVGTRSYQIYVDFDNTHYKLNAGQFVKGRIALASINNALYVPTNVLRPNSTSGAGSYVLAIDNGKVVAKPVKVLLVDNVDKIVAVSGLKLGDRVITHDVLDVQRGTLVKVSD